MIIIDNSNIQDGENTLFSGGNEYNKDNIDINKNDEILGGGILTLLQKGVMEGPLQKKSYYDEYIPMHYILKILQFKLNKSNPGYNDRLFFLVSETGSGKSTAFITSVYRFFNTPNNPYTNQEYFKDIESVSDYDFGNGEIKHNSKEFKKIPQRRIIVSQPKVTTAIEKAVELSSTPKFYPGFELGKNIGFKTGNNKLIPKDDNGIIFSTLGSLTAELLSSTDEEIIDKYNFIIIDECHERNIELDFALVILKKFLKRNQGNPNIPIILLTSATFDYKKYIKYFEANENNYIFVKGTSAKYDVFYADHDIDDIYEETKNILKNKIYTYKESPEIEIENNVLDVLIFLPGVGEINKMKRLLEEYDLTKNEIFQVISSETYEYEGLGYIDMSFEDAKIKSEKTNATRRIILSTSIVETGLTIPTLKWVIDIAYQKTPEYNPVHDFSCLLTKPASKSSIIQRRGRAGRVYPGGIIHCLYTEETFNQLPDYNLPDIYIAYSGDFYLKLLYMNIKNPELIFNKLSHNNFITFINKCVETEDIKETKYKLPLNNRGFDKTNTDVSNCLNMYNLGTIKDLANEVIKLNNMADNIENIEIQADYKLYPPKMLDNYADVSVISYLQKIKSLGFLGTYLGYIASNINFINMEAKRLIMLSYVWKVSLTDLAIIGTFASFKRKDIVELSQSKKKKYKYSSYNLYKTVCKVYKDFGKKYSPDELEIIICDEFIESLILVDLFKYYLKTNEEKGLSYIEDIFIKMGIIFKNFVVTINKVYDTIDSFAGYGFIDKFEPINLFSNVDTFLDKIAILKKCISSAYKNNIIIYDGEKYKTQKGLEITIPPKFGLKQRPKKLVYASLFMTHQMGNIFYECTADRLSILDGYC